MPECRETGEALPVGQGATTEGAVEGSSTAGPTSSLMCINALARNFAPCRARSSDI